MSVYKIIWIIQILFTAMVAVIAGASCCRTDCFRGSTDNHSLHCLHVSFNNIYLSKPN